MVTEEQYSAFVLGLCSPKTLETGDSAVTLAALGMAGETGEVVDLIKKIVFHGHPMNPETKARLIKEMGDIEWYAQLLRAILGVTRDEVLQANIAKLQARYPGGKFTFEDYMRKERSGSDA